MSHRSNTGQLFRDLSHVNLAEGREASMSSTGMT